MIFSYGFWKSLVAGANREVLPSPSPVVLDSPDNWDAETLHVRATSAWKKNDVELAESLMAKACARFSGPDTHCRYAMLLHHMGRSDEAYKLLFDTIARAPWFMPAQTQLARMIKMDRRADSEEVRTEIIQRQALVQSMKNCLARDLLFKPNKFWDAIAGKHESMLDAFGINNFKRTVAHNYQNWLISSADDSQWQGLRALWQKDLFIEPLLNTIEYVDDAGFIWELENPIYALSAPGALAIYKLATGILWEVALARDEFGFLAGFEESVIGNPIRLRRKGVLISQDAAHSARELNTLFGVANLAKDGGLTFAEIGAGQGRLAELIGRTTDHRYYIFDIAPTLAVSQWYLQELFPDEKIFTFRDFDSWDQIEDELNGCRFAFFTANQIKLMPKDSVDVFVNICSLMEMEKRQIDYFLERISEVTRHVFLSKQWYEWDNPNDHIHLTKDDFKLKQGFDLLHEQPDEVYKELFLQIWRRSAPIE